MIYTKDSTVLAVRDKVTARYFSEAGALTQTSAVGSQTVVEYIFMRISNTLQRGSFAEGVVRSEAVSFAQASK